MQLIQSGDRFIAKTEYHEGPVPKAAGFRWDPTAKHWYTPDPARAARCLVEARQQPNIRLVIETDLETVLRNAAAQAEVDAAEDRKAREASLALSHATDADVELPVPDGLAYLPYQRAGIVYALGREATLIGDEMGLGKTIQAVGVINADPTIARALIICPASLRLNWARELRKWLTRDLTVGIAMAGGSWPNADIVIINYDVLKRFGTRIHAKPWDLLVCDESHFLKNPKAQRTQAVVGGSARGDGEAKRAIQARRRIFLTGTPIPNRPIEAWTAVHFLAPEVFSNWKTYATRYCAGHRTQWGWDVSGASHLDELQDKLRSCIMVRRKKADVLTELPAKRRQVLEVQADSAEAAGAIAAEQRAWAAQEEKLERLRALVELSKASEDPAEYEQAVQQLRDASQAAFTELSKLRHATAVAKLPAVIEHVADVVEQVGKVVVMCHHKDIVAGIASHFGAAAVQLTGDTPMAERQANVDRFQADPSCTVFIGTIMAAGVGITLTAASHVVFAELDWVPGNVSQAEDRCHRIGQRDSVTVQHLVLQDSLDARMAHTLVAKQAVIDAALDGHRELLAEPVVPALPTIEAPTEQTHAERPVTRASLAKEADRLMAQPEVAGEVIAAVHACLRVLAGMDADRAFEQNGVGFNRMDTMIGHDLAGRASLTPRQAVLGAKIVRKYHRQLPADLLAKAKEAMAP